MTNLEALSVIFLIWLCTGRGLNLCLVIMFYYAIYMAYPLFPEMTITRTTEAEALVVYASQLSFDMIALVATVAISYIYQKNINIYFLYGAIIATSALLNATMLFGVAVCEESLYWLHAYRQQIAAPLDLLFAALGSAKGGQIIDYTHRNLLGASRSVYNRLNRISYHIKGF